MTYTLVRLYKRINDAPNVLVCVLNGHIFQLVYGQTCINCAGHVSLLWEMGAVIDFTFKPKPLTYVVPHQRFLGKLRHYGIDGPDWSWIEEFLSTRYQHAQCTVVHGDCSSWTSWISRKTLTPWQPGLTAKAWDSTPLSVIVSLLFAPVSPYTSSTVSVARSCNTPVKLSTWLSC